MKLYRSILFVPGSRPDWIAGAIRFGADALVLDLEDAVPYDGKHEARENVRRGIENLRSKIPLMVRVNDLSTGLTADDIHSVAIEGLVAITVPKVERRSDLIKVAAWLDHAEARNGVAPGTVKIVVSPETAFGIMNAYELAASERVCAVAGNIGNRSGDIAKAIGYSWTPEGSETLTIASHILLANRAAGVRYPITGGSTDLDEDLVRRRLKQNRQIGYRGAFVIHPAHVSIANEVYSPSAEEIAWNKGIVEAMAEALKAGKAAARYDGMMVDYAHVRNAVELLEQAAAFGLPVGEYPEISRYG